MTINEQFSAFLDNEATGDERDSVVNALLRDEALRDSWSRQHQIRDALRGGVPGDVQVSVDVAFTSRVMAAIDAEGRDVAITEDVSLVMEQRPSVDDARDDNGVNVVAMKARRPRRRRWRSVAGLAVAASAAGLALFVTQPLQEFDAATHDSSAGTPTTVASADSGDHTGLRFETVASAGAANADSESDFNIPWDMSGDLARSLASRVSQAGKAVGQWTVSNPALASRLNSFLVEHNGLARGYGVGATTPAFVRVATYGQDMPR